MHVTVRRLLFAFVFAGLLSAHLSAQEAPHWVGTWAAAPQAAIRGNPQAFQNQTLRLIVHTSLGGRKVRIRISNAFGDQPLVVGAAHIARRAAVAEIEPASDRAVTFSGQASTTVAAGAMAVSDPVDLEVAPLADLAVSIFLPNATPVTTWHVLAQQTSYLSGPGNFSAANIFPINKKIDYWPFLSGVDVVAPKGAAAIVAFGSSLTDGDGSTPDANRRYPDVLAERLQKEGRVELSVLNEGIIGNRLLSDSDSSGQSGGPSPLGAVYDRLGTALGQAGVRRFERDVLAQPGVKYVLLALGVNDILFPGVFIPAGESVSAERLIAANRELIKRAHKKGIRAIGTTIPPFEHALWRRPLFEGIYTPEKEKVRQQVNAWIRSSGEFDGVIDFDKAVRDPDHPTQILPAFDSGDHLHVNDAGNVAQGNIIDLALFRTR